MRVVRNATIPTDASMRSPISVRFIHKESEAFANTYMSVPKADANPMDTAVRRVGMRLKNTHQYVMMQPCANPKSPHATIDTKSGMPSNARLAAVFATATNASSEPSVRKRLRCSNTQSAFHAQKPNAAASVSTDTMRNSTASRMSQKLKSVSAGLNTAESSQPIRQANPKLASTYVMTKSSGVCVRSGEETADETPINPPLQHLGMTSKTRKTLFQP